jgi:hypothetical protein
MTEILVKRAFLLKGERVEPGTTIAVEHGIAVQLAASGKAELVGEMASPAPMTVESASGLIKGAGAKAKEVTK